MPLGHRVLSSGRSITLTDLRMFSPYEGILEGCPCKRINDRRVGLLQQQAERDFPSMPVHLVVPSREYPDGTARAVRESGSPAEASPPPSAARAV